MQKKIVFVILFVCFVFSLEVQGFTGSSLPMILIDAKGQSIPDEPKITAVMSIVDNANGLNAF